VVKLADFGISKLCNHRENEAEVSSQHSGYAGTAMYLSPEVYSGDKYNHKVDIYGLGLILLLMLFPKTSREELDSVREGNLPEHFGPKEFIPLFTSMVKRNPEERPEAADVEQQCNEIHNIFVQRLNQKEGLRKKIMSKAIHKKTTPYAKPK
jgi:serine/threonine protein kinase